MDDAAAAASGRDEQAGPVVCPSYYAAMCPAVQIVFARKAQGLAGALHARFGASDGRFAFADVQALCADSGPDMVAALRAAGVLQVSGKARHWVRA